MMNINSYSQSQRNSIPTNCNNSEDTTKNAFSPGGCPGLIDGRRCGETRNLDIIKEFNKLYAAKMKQIDDVAGGDCAQAKITLQQEWIKDLSEQNEMLVSVVEELEVEAADRVTMLEEKLQNSAKCACESEQLMKEKDRRLKEFEEKIRKMNETMEKNEEARRACQQYAELKKKMEEEQGVLLGKIRCLEADNKEMRDAIMKSKKNLEKLEARAEQYLEERDDIKRKHRESLEMIETLQKENTRSKESLQTLEEEKKVAVTKLQSKLMQDLDEYERKHRDSLGKLDTLRVELEKTKNEHQSSVTKVKTLSDENRFQAETISSLHDKIKKYDEKRPTITKGINCKPSCRDSGVDPCCPSTRCIGVDHIPETKTTGTLSDIEAQIIPTIVTEQTKTPHRKQHLRTIACETEMPSPPRKREPHFDTITTVHSFDEMEAEFVYTVDRPPILKKKDIPQALDHYDMDKLVTFGLPKEFEEDTFDNAKSKFIVDSNERNINHLLQAQILDKLGLHPENTYRELSVYKPIRDAHISQKKPYNTEVIYSNHTCHSSNESMRSDDADDIFNQAFIDKDNVTVKICPKCKDKSKEVCRERTDEESDISATYYSIRDSSDVHKPHHMKKEAFEVEHKKELHQTAHSGGHSRSTSPERSNTPGAHPSKHGYERESRSASPRRTSTSSSSPAEDLQTVVHDLNESVSRIMEKSPNEKATRLKIKKLEEQLRTALKQKEHDVEVERQRRNQEVENLKLTIREMEKALQNKELNASSLQSAVDLYLNSITVLEHSEDRYKNEVTQQRITISNLQEALVTTKQQLDEVRQKCQNDVSSTWTSWFTSTS